MRRAEIIPLPAAPVADGERLLDIRETLGVRPADALAPLLIGADRAGPMCGRSEASWWRDHAAGRVPSPAWKSPGRTLWSVEELRSWIAHSCPPRKEWAAIRAAGKRGRT